MERRSGITKIIVLSLQAILNTKLLQDVILEPTCFHITPQNAPKSRLGGVFGGFLGRLGDLLGRLGGLLGLLGGPLSQQIAILSQPGTSSSRLGRISEPSWAAKSMETFQSLN